MKQTLSIIFLMLAIVCKSQTTEHKWIKLKEFAKECYKNDILKKDPLILLDGRPVGLLSEINLNDFKFSPIHTSSIDVIPKGSKYLKSIWGENAENGAINVSKRIHLHCGVNRPRIVYLVNDVEMYWEVAENLNPEIIKDRIEIENVIDDKGNDLTLIIINTKR